MIKVTEKAVNHINQESTKYGEYPLLLIKIKKMGCSGYGYDFEFMENQEVDQSEYYMIVGEDWNFKVLLPKKFYDSLKGSEIDYQKVDSFNTKLVMNIPLAENHCGCGESFNFDS